MRSVGLCRILPNQAASQGSSGRSARASAYPIEEASTHAPKSRAQEENQGPLRY
jgi:hypothetical protein